MPEREGVSGLRPDRHPLARVAQRSLALRLRMPPHGLAGLADSRRQGHIGVLLRDGTEGLG